MGGGGDIGGKVWVYDEGRKFTQFESDAEEFVFRLSLRKKN